MAFARSGNETVVLLAFGRWQMGRAQCYMGFFIDGHLQQPLLTSFSSRTRA